MTKKWTKRELTDGAKNGWFVVYGVPHSVMSSKTNLPLGLEREHALLEFRTLPHALSEPAYWGEKITSYGLTGLLSSRTKSELIKQKIPGVRTYVSIRKQDS